MLPRIQIRKMGSKFIRIRIQSFMTSHCIKKNEESRQIIYNRSIIQVLRIQILLKINFAKPTKSYFQTTQFVFGLVPNLCIES